MAFNGKAVVDNGHFAGSSRVWERDQRGLAEIVKGLLVRDAIVRIDAEGITAITDSSGGTAGGTLAVVTLPAEADVSSATTGVLPSSFDTSTLTVEDAYGTLLEQANLVYAELNLGSVGEGDGTAGAGTIAAIDESVANNTGDADALSKQSSDAIFQQLLDNQETVRQVIDVARRAVGLADTTQAAGGGSDQGTAGAALEVGSVDAGVADDDAVEAVLATAVDLALGVLNDNVSELSDQLDEVTAIAETTGPVPQNVAGRAR